MPDGSAIAGTIAALDSVCLHCNHTTEDHVRARLVRIGNSRGLRLAKPLLEQLGLEDEVELEARDGELIVRAARGVRVGWAEAASRLAARHEGMLDPMTPTLFDDAEWEWR